MFISPFVIYCLDSSFLFPLRPAWHAFVLQRTGRSEIQDVAARADFAFASPSHGRGALRECNCLRRCPAGHHSGSGPRLNESRRYLINGTSAAMRMSIKELS